MRRIVMTARGPLIFSSSQRSKLGSASELASALRRAAAHGKHEKRIGEADSNWPDWYAEHMAHGGLI